MNPKSIFLVLISVLIIGGVVTAFYIVQNPFSPENQPPDENQPTKTSAVINGLEVNDYLYLLQYDNFEDRSDVIAKIGETEFDLVVMDTFYNDGTPWTNTEISSLKTSIGGEKIIISYISIGEAESYRYYWNESWESNPPDWLDEENPDWAENYKVKFWMEGWQKILFDYVENYTVKAGFDGIFLDIIDAYEYYEDQGIDNAADLMVDFVRNISKFCRSTLGISNFLIVPQNGEALGDYPGYLEAISGLAKEDIFYIDDDKNTDTVVDYVTGNIEAFIEAGKFVLATEYCREPAHIDDVYNLAWSHGYIPYATVRDLDQIVINEGYEPD